ncbi:HEPN domain-containing protein [Methylocella silvestris]|uniref:HEPN domain-containing protein n=1 Tax=Methylocella silvestris TaxID=199596 RepID=UPI0011AF6FBD|nr:HEPN domain-containing protein [Methylocella silvestris]
MGNNGQLQSRKNIQKALDNFLTCADEARCKTNEQASTALRGGNVHRMAEGGIWLHTPQLIEKISTLVRECLVALNAFEIHETDIKEAMWSAATAETNSKNRHRQFFELIETARNVPQIFLAANHLFVLRDPVKIVEVGDVVILRTAALANDESLALEIRVGEAEGIHFTEAKPILELPFMAWKVLVSTSVRNADEEARWKINIAISLLRCALLTLPSALRPPNGDVEHQPTEPSRITAAALLEGRSCRFSDNYGHRYQIDEIALNHLNEWKLNDTAAEIFYPQKDTVGERLNRGLGWMTLARQTKLRAERFMHFFTSLEALLTKKDQSVPITQNIARSVACIISNNPKSRIDISKSIIDLYAKRSSLIHGGTRAEIHASDVYKLQSITEIVYWTVITRKPVKTIYQDFSRELERASFGLEWPESV